MDEFSFEESLATLRSLVGGALNHFKSNSEAPFDIKNYIKTQEECQDLLASIGYLEQTAEALRTPLAKQLLSGSVVFKPNDNIVVQHPQYQALYGQVIAQRNALERYQTENPDLASVVKSLADSETQRSELIHRIEHIQAANKEELTALGAEMSQIRQEKRNLEGIIESLRKENAALAKSRGNKVEAIQEEMENIRRSAFMQTEKMQLLEDQNRQTLMILASEMSQLKEKLAQYESESSKNDNTSAFSEISKTREMTRQVLSLRDRKRQLVEQMVASKVDDTLAAVNKIIAEKKEEIERQKQEMTEKAKLMTQKTNEQEVLMEHVEESKKQVEILDQALIDVEESIKTMIREKELIDQRLREKVDELDIREQESNEQSAMIQGLSAQIKKLTSQIQELEKQFEESITEMEKLEMEFTEVSSTKTAMNSKISEVNAKSSNLKGEIEKCREEIEGAEKALDESTKKAAEMEEELNQAKSKLEVKMEEIRAGDERINNIRQSVADVENSIHAAEEQMVTTEAELNDVMNQNESVLNQLRDIKFRVLEKFESDK